MTSEDDSRPVSFIEDRVPYHGLEEAVQDLVELYGGEVTASAEREQRFILPLRRGMATAGAVECKLTWAPDDDHEGTLTLTCDRDVDAPKLQRILLLSAGVAGSFLFMIWPFFPAKKELGALAWLGGAVAIAVYVMTLRRTSGGIASDFLQRLARHQRELVATDGQ